MTDPRIEAVARAMCVAHGIGPNDTHYDTGCPMWQHRTALAQQHIAAYDTLRKMEKTND